MGLLADIVTIFHQGYGWIFVLLILGWELFAPQWLNRDTALAPLVKGLPKTLESLKEDQTELKEKVEDVQEKQREATKERQTMMQVQRAHSRGIPQVREEEVDSYLKKNGVDINTFLKGDPMSGYSNWEDEEREEDT